MTIELNKNELILEAALFSAMEPLSVDKLMQLFAEEDQPSLGQVREWLSNLSAAYENRGVELKEVASGFRFQVRVEFAPFVQRLEERKPARYSRTFLETLALIAYRQPVTRGEIEDVRGVAVNPNVIKTLLEREWIKIAGYRDVPGKPALFATTKTFLDYFNLKSIAELPPLSELVDFESLEKQLGLHLPALMVPVESSENLEEDGVSEESEQHSEAEAQMNHEEQNTIS